MQKKTPNTHTSTLFYWKIYVFSNKHYIAPVKINIITIYICNGKPLNLQLAASHLNLIYQTQKFILKKNGDTEKIVIVTQ